MTRISEPAGWRERNDGRKWGDTVHHGRDHEVDELRRLYMTDKITIDELDRLLGYAFMRPD
jgi:hypothetical protein